MTKEQAVKVNSRNIYTGLSPKGYGFTCFANKDFKPRDLVVHGHGKLIDHQTAHCSIQIDKNKHILPNKWTGRYWNHSCNPNTYISTRRGGFPDLRALKYIKKGEEITYSYFMTEYAWSKYADESEISCSCGERTCRKKIPAFSDLSKHEQVNLVKKGLCSAYLAKLI